MKIFFISFALLAVLLAVYPFVFDESEPGQKVEGLPWQIELGVNGASTVFGLTPGKSSLADAVSVLGDDAQLAIVESKGEVGTLEMYFGHYRAGLISGKMILQAEVAPETLEIWKQAAVKVDYMPSGLARKYTLDSDNLPIILESVVQNITFIPAVNLDEAIVLGRFGEPQEKIVLNETLTHYLYPSMGLDIALSSEQKDVLQYVAPAEFENLRAPLLKDKSVLSTDERG